MSEIKELEKKMMERFDKMDERMDRMDARFDKMDERMDRMDARFDKTDARFDKFEHEVILGFRDLSNEMGRMHAETLEKFKEVDDHFKQVENRLDNVESLAKTRWIAPDIPIRLSALETVVGKHSEQLALLAQN